jgi:hypothetical protein
VADHDASPAYEMVDFLQLERLGSNLPSLEGTED